MVHGTGFTSSVPRMDFERINPSMPLVNNSHRINQTENIRIIMAFLQAGLELNGNKIKNIGIKLCFLS